MYWFTGFGGFFLFCVGNSLEKMSEPGILVKIAALGLDISGIALMIYTVYKTRLWKKL